MKVLVTAIGSMSSECVVGSLLEAGFQVVGTDLYPAAYNPVSGRCAAFAQMPKAYDDPDGYCRRLGEFAVAQGAEAVIPLTDPEVDVLSASRWMLERLGLSLWLAGDQVISCVRSKRMWRDVLRDCALFKTIPTYGSYEELKAVHAGRFVAKRVNGRSSEGIAFGDTRQSSFAILSEGEYVFQPYVEGDVVTVDVARHPRSGRVVSLPRVERLRTKNGAGTVVEILSPELTAGPVEEMVRSLGVTGVMNCEFIRDGDALYLMDINPRFSAGVSFSKMAGYDFVKADAACYRADDLASLPSVKTGAVFVKRFCDFQG